MLQNTEQITPAFICVYLRISAVKKPQSNNFKNNKLTIIHTSQMKNNR